MYVSMWLSILMVLFLQIYVSNSFFLDAMTSALATIPFSGAPMTSGLVGAKLAMGTQLLYNLGFYGTRPKLPKAKPKMVNPPIGIPKVGMPSSVPSGPVSVMGGAKPKSTAGSALGDTDLTLIFQALRSQGFDPTTALQMIESGVFDNLPQGAVKSDLPQGVGGFGNLPQGVGGFGNLPQGVEGFGNLPQGIGGFGNLPQGVEGFGNLPQGVGGFGNLPQGIEGFGNLPQGVEGFDNLPQGVGGFDNLPQGAVKSDLPQGVRGFGNLPQGVEGFGNLPQGVEGFDNLPQGFGGFDNLPQDLVRSDNLPQDVLEFDNIPQGEGEGSTNFPQDFSDHPDPVSDRSPEEEAEEIFTFIKMVDDDGCMSRVVCKIGKDPTFIGQFSASIYNVLKTAKRGSSSVVDQYIDIMEAGRRDEDCVERYPQCTNENYEAMLQTVYLDNSENIVEIDE